MIEVGIKAQEAELKVAPAEKIHAIHAASDQSYGLPRVTAELRGTSMEVDTM
ncbi:hypothetical protein ACWDWS_38980 [Streptomyces sp. NPDC003328]